MLIHSVNVSCVCYHSYSFPTICRKEEPLVTLYQLLLVAPVTWSDVKDPQLQLPFPVPMRRFQPPLSWGVSGRMPTLTPGSWLLAFLQLHLAIWVRAVQRRESLFSGDWVVRSSFLLKPAEAKRRNLLLRCWDVPWTLKAGSIAGREPGIGKSGTSVCVLSLWGCWVSCHSPPQTSFWLQCAHRRKRPP